MATLDTILAYKQQKDQQANADLQAIPQAAMMLQQAKQQQYDNMIKGALAQGSLASAGLTFDTKSNTLKPYGTDKTQLANLLTQSSIAKNIAATNKLTKDNNQDKPVYTVDAQGKLNQVGVVPGKSTVKQLPLSPEQVGKRSEESRQAVVNNPMVNQDTQGAVAAYQYTAPRLKEITDIVNSGALKGDVFSRLAKQITVGKSGELVVPDGSPLETMIGRINDIKLTGFGLGGKNFTENEAKIIFGRLDPTGKSDKRFIQDINSLQEFFKLKADAGTRGLKETKNIMAQEQPGSSNTQSIGKFKIISVK